VTAVCLQVRLDSNRLPEKALIKIEDLTIIEHAMKALREVNADQFLLLTTEECVSRLNSLAEKWGFSVFSGPKDNVLKRFTDAAEKYNITTVIRATGDNPLVSAEIANEVLDEHRKTQVDYTNWTDAPLGTGVEIVETAALYRALAETDKKYDLEHVTPWIYNNPEKFQLNIHRVPSKYIYIEKVSVDTPDDLRKMKDIYGALYKNRPIEMEELIRYLKRDILLIPSTKEGNGTGHIKRMLSLFEKLKTNVFLYIENSEKERLSSLLGEIDNIFIISSLENLSRFGKIVIDMRSLDEELFYKYFMGLNLIAIDEGGPLREKIPYLIDILPLPKSFSDPNVSSVSFLDLPEKKSAVKNGKILVTFGGEDPAGLTDIVCNLLNDKFKEYVAGIDIVLGPLYKGKEPDNQFNVIRSPSTLHDILPGYSGVISSFGITAFEANALDIPVLLINPSDYHEELGNIKSFTSAGVNRIDIDIFSEFLSNPSCINPIEIDTSPSDLGSFISKLDNLVPQCPLCLNRDIIVVTRYEDRSYCRCGNCRMLFMLNFNMEKIVYNKDYFFNQYENQYGKTYLDDFEHISQLSSDRLKIIMKKKGKNSTLLDVGCAYGPFLDQAGKNNLIPYGTDISSDAVSYVRDELGYPVRACEFNQFDIPKSWKIDKFDIITMWYVIEHFQNLSAILSKVNSLLELGGVFSFSTPSGSGISARKNLKEFLFHSPDDHYTIWETENSRNLLDLYGFKIYRKKVTGHHPERFPSFLSKSKMGRIILNLVSHVSGLGDTFEIYACKVREL